MRRYAALWTLICCSVCNFVTATEPESPAAPATTGSISTPDPTAGLSPSDPGKSLSAARGLFLQVDATAAAARLRESSKELRLAARDAAAEVRESLSDAADDLEILSRGVEARSIRTIDELDRPLARALHAIAHYHILKGQQQWHLRDRRQAGHRLRAAADSLEQAAAAAGNRLSSDADRAIRDSRLVSGRLIEGAGYATDEVGKSFESLGQHIESLGASLKPITSRKPADSVR